MNEKKKIIIAEHLCFSYEKDDGEKRIIDDVSFSIEEGSYVTVIGHNGSGKSTLAKLLSVILAPDSGKLEISGIDATEASKSEELLLKIRENVGMVFQNPDNQLVATVVEEDVAFGPENIGVPSADIRKRVDSALKAVGMSEFSLHSPHRLSGGQKQRVAIAGILALMPRVMILDESTAMLDPSGRDEVLQTVHRLNKENGITVIQITHYMDEAANADRVIALDGGKIMLDGSPKQVFAQVGTLRDSGLDVPQITKIIFDADEKFGGFGKIALSVEEAADMIAEKLNKK